MNDKIKVFGARVHNLKNIDVEIPKNKLVVITGLSGSGKSSLAFDTIYAEGQRRYVESLSTYARQFLGHKDKPDVDRIEGLSPAIAIDQRAVTHNPRSTVGTMTEIYDFLRILFSNAAIPHCPICGQVIEAQSLEAMSGRILELCQQSHILILAPLVSGKKGAHRQVLSKIKEAEYSQVRINGYICSIEEVIDYDFDRTKRHTIEVIVDRVKMPSGKIIRVDCNQIYPVKSLTKSQAAQTEPGQFNGLKKKRQQNNLFFKILNTALDLGDGILTVYDIDQQRDYLFSSNLACQKCNINLPKLEPGLFSFNSPRGACATSSPRCLSPSGSSDRKSTRLNSSHTDISRMPSSA